MSDIADAAGMSRPTLYAVYPNKEAVFSAIAEQHREQAERATEARLPGEKSLEAQLALIFEIWIIEPFASVIDSPSGLDLLGNAEAYAPEAVGRMYARFEHYIIRVLQPEMPKKRTLAARDLAHVVMLATKGLKASTTSLAELRRMTDGLITMAVATTRVAAHR